MENIKTIKKLNMFIWLLLLFILLPGFSLLKNGNQWDIQRDSSTLSKLFISYTSSSQAIPNDLPTSDPLYGLGDLTLDQIMSSIISDYNSINGSFLTLALPSDSDFSSRGTNRTIQLSFASTSGANVGEAQQKFEGSTVIGCEVNLKSSLLDSAQNLVTTITHELGHCVGFDHPQQVTHSIMSYYSDVTRLQSYDKMGIVHLYPVDTSYGQEEGTWGLSCERKN